jgi:hypothetical protein
VERKTDPSVAFGNAPPVLSRDEVSGVAVVKTTIWDCSRLFCGIAAGSLVMLAAVSGKPATAQSADAQERCTEDVMRRSRSITGVTNEKTAKRTTHGVAS